MPGKRAVVYCRISQDRGGERVGVDRQVKDCMERIEAAGYTLAAAPFVDNNISAYSGKPRPAYRDMVKLIESDGIGVIVVWHIDRLYRSPRELEDLIDLVGDRSMIVDAVTASTVDLSNTDGQAMARIGVAIARKSSDDTRRRVKSSKAAAREAGLHLGGGRKPWGYDWFRDDAGVVVEGAGLHVVKEEAAAIREAVERILQGESLYRITQDFRSRDLPAPRKPAFIARVLVGRNGRKSLLTGGANWPAIITEDEARAVAARLAARHPYKTSDRRTGRHYALTGLLVCSKCGKKMLGSGGYYRCAAINGGCGKVSIKARELEDALDTLIQRRREHGEARDEDTTPVVVDTEAQQAALAEVASIEARIAETRAAVADGGLSPRDAGPILDALEVKRTEATARFAVASPEVQPKYADMQAAFDAIDDWRERWVAGELTDTELADLHDMFAVWIEAVKVAPAIKRGSPFDERRIKVRWR